MQFVSIAFDPDNGILEHPDGGWFTGTDEEYIKACKLWESEYPKVSKNMAVAWLAANLPSWTFERLNADNGEEGVLSFCAKI